MYHSKMDVRLINSVCDQIWAVKMFAMLLRCSQNGIFSLADEVVKMNFPKYRHVKAFLGLLKD